MKVTYHPSTHYDDNNWVMHYIISRGVSLVHVSTGRDFYQYDYNITCIYTLPIIVSKITLICTSGEWDYITNIVDSSHELQ